MLIGYLLLLYILLYKLYWFAMQAWDIFSRFCYFYDFIHFKAIYYPPVLLVFFLHVWICIVLLCKTVSILGKCYCISLLYLFDNMYMQIEVFFLSLDSHFESGTLVFSENIVLPVLIQCFLSYISQTASGLALPPVRSWESASQQAIIMEC